MPIRSRTSGSRGNATSHSVTLPTGIVAGDRLVVGFVNDNATTESATTSTGWTRIGTQPQGGSTNLRLSIFTKVATGSDALTVTLTDSGGNSPNQEAAWVSVCLIGNGGDALGDAAAMADGSSATTATVGAVSNATSGDYDSIIFLGIDNNGSPSHPLASRPSGWDNPTTPGDNTAGVVIHSADRSVEGFSTSFSPGNFTWTNADQWVTGHVVFPAPAALDTVRFYFTNVDASYGPGATQFAGDFDSTSIGPAVTAPRLLGTAPAGASDSVSFTETSAAVNVAMLRQFVSHPASAAGTITGVWQQAAGWMESLAADMRPYLQVWVTQGDSPDLRGSDAVVFVGGDSTLEMGTSPAGRVFASTAVQTEVAFQAGDRIVAELSVYSTNTSSTALTGTVYFGGTGSPDMASGATDMDQPGWLDLQITPGVAFVEPPGETRRFYLANRDSTSADVPVASWVNDDTGAQDQHLLTETPGGLAASFSRDETTSTTPWYVLLGRWVSTPVSVAGTVYGNWRFGAALLESSTSADFEPLIVVHGTVGLTDVERGTAISAFLSGVDLPVSTAAESWGNAGTGADLDLQVGDRLVVSLGYVARNTVTTPYTGTLHFGGTSSPDLAAGDTDFDRPAWVNLRMSPGLAFVPPTTSGAASSALGPFSSSATGDREVEGAASATLGALTASAAGGVLSPAVTGTAYAGMGPDPDEYPADDQYPSDDEYPAEGLPRGMGGLVATATGTTAISVEGTASAALGALTGTAPGVRSTSAPAAAPLGPLVAAATGTRVRAGSATGILGGLSAAVTGLRTATGTAVAQLSALVATASARPQILGAASAELGGVSGTVAGTRTSVATADSDLGGLTVAATGTRVATGSLAAPLGPLEALATGDITVTASASAPLGSLTATAAGQRTTEGSGSSNLGGLAALVSVVPTGAAAADLGALTSAATGDVEHPGAATAPLGPLSAATPGQREVFALVTAPLGSLTGFATGTRTTEGSASVVLGALVAVANGDGFAIIVGSGATDLGGLRAFGQGAGFLPHVIPHAGQPAVVGGVSAGLPVAASTPSAGSAVVVESITAGLPTPASSPSAGQPVVVESITAGTPAELIA